MRGRSSTITRVRSTGFRSVLTCSPKTGLWILASSRRTTGRPQAMQSAKVSSRFPALGPRAEFFAHRTWTNRGRGDRTSGPARPNLRAVHLADHDRTGTAGPHAWRHTLSATRTPFPSDLGSCAARRAGSSPAFPTTTIFCFLPQIWPTRSQQARSNDE